MPSDRDITPYRSSGGANFSSEARWMEDKDDVKDTLCTLAITPHFRLGKAEWSTLETAFTNNDANGVRSVKPQHIIKMEVNFYLNFILLFHPPSVPLKLRTSPRPHRSRIEAGRLVTSV